MKRIADNLLFYFFRLFLASALFQIAVYGVDTQPFVFSNGNTIKFVSTRGNNSLLEFKTANGRKKTLKFKLDPQAKKESLTSTDSNLFLTSIIDENALHNYLVITETGEVSLVPRTSIGAFPGNSFTVSRLKDRKDNYLVITKKNSGNTKLPVNVVVIRNSDKKFISLNGVSQATNQQYSIKAGVIKVGSNVKNSSINISDFGDTERAEKLSWVIPTPKAKTKPKNEVVHVVAQDTKPTEIVAPVPVPVSVPVPVPVVDAPVEKIEVSILPIEEIETVTDPVIINEEIKPESPPENDLPKKPKKAVNTKENKKWTKNSKEFQKRKVFLEGMELALRQEFTGYDSIISQVMNRISEIELNPEVRRPLQPIILVGLPGIGKSLFVRRISELLALTDATFGITAESGDTSIPVDVFYKAAKNALHGRKGVSGISFIDEIQRIVAPDQDMDIEKIKEELKAQGYKEKVVFLPSMQSTATLNTTPPVPKIAIAEEEEEEEQTEKDKKTTEENQAQQLESKKQKRGVQDTLTLEDKLKEILETRKAGVRSSARSIRVLRDATSGQGEIAGTAELPVETLIKPINTFLQHYAEAQAEHREWLAEAQEEISGLRADLVEIKKEKDKFKSPEKKSQYNQQINYKKAAIKEKQDEIKEEAKTVVETAAKKVALEDSLKALLESYPQLFEPFKGLITEELDQYMRPEKLLTRFLIQSPIETIRKLKEGARNLGPDPKIYIGNQLSFWMGNDVDYNHELLTQRVSDTNNPDLIREADLAFQESPEGLKFKEKLVRQIFGNNADWASFASRLNFPWRYLTPWGKMEWKKFAQDLLKKDSRALSGHLNEKFGSEVKIHYDSSVDRVLHEYGVKPIHGPRVMANAPADVLGTLKVNIQAAIVNAKAENHHGPLEVSIAYDFEKKEFYAPIFHDGVEIARAKASGDVLERGVKPAPKETEEESLTPLRKGQIARREAAKILMGMLFMGSVPEKYQFNPRKEITGETIWNQPDPNLKIWEHKRNSIMILLAGIASDSLQLGGSLSPESRQDVNRVRNLVTELMNDITQDAKAQDFPATDGVPKEKVEESTKAIKEIDRAIDALVEELRRRPKQKDKKKKDDKKNDSAQNETEIEISETEMTENEEESEFWKPKPKETIPLEERVVNAKKTVAELIKQREADAAHKIRGIDLVISKSRQEEPIFKELIQGRLGEALERGTTVIVGLLEKSPKLTKLYGRLTREIESGKEITSEEFRKWIEDANLSREVPKLVLEHIATAPPGTPVMKSCNAMMEHIVFINRPDRAGIFGRIWKFLNKPIKFGKISP